ncbi:MAG: hypothetical protein GF387_02165 [Candidatus Portnoybacteria bacterium]|nr:hypothetical protein [Candidatus Portnoybacteria bacterium]
MKLSKKALGLSLGILWGLSVFIATIYILLKGGGNTMVLIQQFYWGYNISIGGAFLGLIYGFIDGFIGGWLIALLYNAFTKKKEKPVE